MKPFVPIRSRSAREPRRTLRAHAAFTLSAALFTAGATAQVMQPQGTYPNRFAGQHAGPQARPAAQAPAAAMNPAPPPPPVPTTTPSLLDEPAQPAKVDIAGGQLTVHADNSSLTAIMSQVSTSAGMTIDGLNKDERVFGTYGPGDPREVLTSLLDGTGYNVVMFGKTTAGTPSQISLTPRGAGVAKGGSSNTPPQMQEDEEEPQQQQYNDPPAVPESSPNTNGPQRTPQQMLEQLQQQRLQQQQQQQQPPNPQQQP